MDSGMGGRSHYNCTQITQIGLIYTDKTLLNCYIAKWFKEQMA